jgi:uncharacterized membrane protein (DUF2068 family)
MREAADPEQLGLRAIRLYKWIKACVQLGTALALLVLWPFGVSEHVHALALALRHHVTHGWALRLADALLAHATRAGVAFSIAALTFDGTLTGVEAWALARGHAWGAWLVVLTTSCLLPFELIEFLKMPRVSRVLVFFANLAIVLYLGRRALREHRAARARRR